MTGHNTPPGGTQGPGGTGGRPVQPGPEPETPRPEQREVPRPETPESPDALRRRKEQARKPDPPKENPRGGQRDGGR